uniref:Uncharacterized protein n=1 Tax=Picea glauca TaxID=3330 RepID=A0A101M1V2_PICGL|nr:hypothetical protein ABT39_MTgene2736 [Picea glauca]QHR90514.1 hypothetical protein Q903MT_gene4539 [Picea sitchensis]
MASLPDTHSSPMDHERIMISTQQGSYDRLRFSPRQLHENTAIVLRTKNASYGTEARSVYESSVGS